LNRFTVLAAIVATAISLGVVAVASAQVSPTPAPTGTAAPSVCTGVPQRGGETVTLGQNAVTPPGGGDFTIQAVAPPPDIGFIACYVGGNASVTISRECDEISRENPDDDPGADFVLDLIVDSCERISPTATPTQLSQGSNDDDVVTTTPTATSGSTISPPSTGDAGLR